MAAVDALRALNHEREKETVTPAERVLVAVVALAVIVFEAWFFFFSGSPIGSA